MEFTARTIVVLCLLTVGSFSAYAENSMWQDMKPLAKKTLTTKNEFSKTSAKLAYQNARYLTLDIQQMKDRLTSANRKIAAAKSLVGSKNPKLDYLELPLPDGRLVSVSISQNMLLPLNIREKYPALKTLDVNPDQTIASGKIDVTSAGFHAMLKTRAGKTVFIDPTENGTYVSYQKSNQQHKHGEGFSCSVHSQKDLFGQPIDLAQQLPKLMSKSLNGNKESRTDKSLINYRIAIAVTGEYTQKNGGTVEGALSAITTTINRVNQVYEQDLGIHLSLVEGNDQLIYVDENTDPYSGSNSKELLYQNQENIDAIIGSENYDVGHLFTTSGGGLASIGSACNDNRKAQGISGISNPQNDSFNLDFVAHEIGHQFGATHTFNGVQGLCSGNTRSAQTAFEPGSGSTIMSYAGYCAGDNLQSNSDAMFHIGSIQQIRSYVSAKTSCGANNNITNAAPKVDAGINHVIPAQTPFELVGTATDADGDALIYGWEQVDAGEVAPVDTDTGDNALFRVRPLSGQKNRIFPSLQTLLKHSTERGENLPIRQRLMKFRFVVQDSHNTTQSDSMSILVQRTGSRFALNMPRYQYSLGETHQILWNKADTDLAPINCSSVDVSLSIDGGYNFKHILAEGIPNTGDAWITIPSTVLPTSRGRFKVSCRDNIFFAVSSRDFKINNQKHADRLVLIDEDQPETNLKDIDLNKINVSVDSGSTDTSTNQFGKGGGSMNWLFVLLMIVGLKKFRSNRNYLV